MQPSSTLFTADSLPFGLGLFCDGVKRRVKEFHFIGTCLVNLIPLDRIVDVAVSVISGLGIFGHSDDEKLELGRLPAKELSALLWVQCYETFLSVIYGFS